MILLLAAGLIWGFLLLRVFVALVNLFFSILPKSVPEKCPPLVSVLIPARNEAERLPELLFQLIQHDYRKMEILVYDDLSEDDTAEVIKSCARMDERIRYMEGKSLPEGWLGKNHACHQLAMHAKGDYLLFLDADVRIEKGLVMQSVSYAHKHKLALLSLFPVQQMHTLAERLVVPLMNWILVGLLPMKLTRWSSRPSLSAANGQFMLFETETYRKYRFHEMVKAQKVEDILIFKKIKQLSKSTAFETVLKAETMLSNGMVKCRMYESWKEALDGFSKNVFEFFGGSPLLTLLFVLISSFGFVVAALYGGWWHLAVFLGMSLFLRIIVSIASRQSLFWNALLTPLQQFSFLILVFYAMRKRKRHNNQWKGRNVDVVQGK